MWFMGNWVEENIPMYLMELTNELARELPLKS